jgi:hypothetical protein
MGYGRILCWGMGGYCDGVWEDIVMGYGRILWWGMGGYCVCHKQQGNDWYSMIGYRRP